MAIASLHIIIIADQTPRAKTILQILRNSLGSGVTFETLNKKELQEMNLKHHNVVCLVDLLSGDDSSFNMIESIKKILPHAGIIALHIYRSKQLIEPLYERGIDGYVFSEPSRNELTRAIEIVASGQVYRPSFMQNT